MKYFDSCIKLGHKAAAITMRHFFYGFTMSMRILVRRWKRMSNSVTFCSIWIRWRRGKFTAKSDTQTTGQNKN